MFNDEGKDCNCSATVLGAFLQKMFRCSDLEGFGDTCEASMSAQTLADSLTKAFDAVKSLQKPQQECPYDHRYHAARDEIASDVGDVVRKEIQEAVTPKYCEALARQASKVGGAYTYGSDYPIVVSD